MTSQVCTLEYSKGNGTGVAEALGNWGFSNEVASPGHELQRMQCLLERMEALKEKPKCPLPSPANECPSHFCMMNCNLPTRRSNSTDSKKKPLIIYSSIEETLFTANKKLVRDDKINPILGRSYAHQGTDKWYKLGPRCCPQPSCPAPSFSPSEKACYRRSYCTRCNTLDREGSL